MSDRIYIELEREDAEIHLRDAGLALGFNPVCDKLRAALTSGLPSHRYIPAPGEKDCKHEWVDPSNRVVEAGDYRLCLKCHGFAIPAPEGSEE